MADMMNFPKRWEDFLHDYEFEDARRIYTNESRLIPSFRVKRMMEHYAPMRFTTAAERRMIMRLIDANALITEYDRVHIGEPGKARKLIEDAPTVDAVQVVRCKDCVHFEDAKVNAKGFLICPNTGMDIWDECYCAHGEKRIIEPQPDGIQFRTVDDLGRICIPKDIRDKLGIKPGTECAVYATDELTPEQIIVIRRNKKK